MKDINALPESFLYSQQSLSAFKQCPMRFKKRYMENLRWESVFETEKKKAIDRGRDFHLLARRYFLGLDADPHTLGTEDEILDLWMHNLKQTFRLEPGIVYLPEYTIIMRAGKLRLQATIDLIAVRKDRIEIWDWKTHNTLFTADASKTAIKLEKSFQTKVYLFMLKEYSGNIVTDVNAESNGYAAPVENISPDGNVTMDGNVISNMDIALAGAAKLADSNISMHYWQPDAPGAVVNIDYSDSVHEENRKFLEDSISAIEGYDWNNFDKMLYSRQCRHCEFNWFCNGPAAAAAGISNGWDYIEYEES